MRVLTGAERVMRALRREEPDRVPTFEMDIHRDVINAIKPGLDYVEFCDYMDLDAIVFNDQRTVKWEMVDPAKQLGRSEWGNLSQFTGASESAGIVREPAIKTAADVEKFVAPDPDDPTRYEAIAAAVKRFHGRRAVIATVLDPFHRVSTYLRGHEVFRDMILAPEMVDEMIAIARRFAVRYAQNCIAVGVDAVWNAGDWAVTQGPFVSRDFTKRFLVPGLKDVVECAHAAGVPCLMHTDGNIRPIIDLVVGTGIDGLNPIDPTAGMDLGVVKAQYGDRVCLMGNVDCGELLCWGSKEEVRQTVKDCIAKAGHGGGFICMSSNTIHGGVDPENYVAMVSAIRDYGVYPLAV